MHKLTPETQIVIASHNQGKVQEMADLLAPYQIKVLTAEALGLPEPEETGATFRENAELKARLAADKSGQIALSDDSGLAVEALNGAPGILSARWAGAERDFTQACQRVWDNISENIISENISSAKNLNTNAAFICVLALAWPQGQVVSFEGRVDGQIVWPPRGQNGFGYDPIFVANGHRLSFGEMKPEDKHKISHRARAFKLMKQSCLEI